MMKTTIYQNRDITRMDVLAGLAMAGILANRDTAPEADFMFVIEQAVEYAKMLDAEIKRREEKDKEDQG